MTEPTAKLTRTAGLTIGALLASSATLVCCVLPAVLVEIGAGVALVGLVTAVPQLVWLNEHKPWGFGIAGALLAMSGTAVWRARSAPCPTRRPHHTRLHATPAGQCGRLLDRSGEPFPWGEVRVRLPHAGYLATNAGLPRPTCNEHRV